MISSTISSVALIASGYAERGKSTMGWYFGFKLHLICNERGELLNFMLTKANVDDRNTDVFNRLSDNVFGKLFADKGYISHGSCSPFDIIGKQKASCNLKNQQEKHLKWNGQGI